MIYVLVYKTIRKQLIQIQVLVELVVRIRKIVIINNQAYQVSVIRAFLWPLPQFRQLRKHHVKLTILAFVTKTKFVVKNLLTFHVIWNESIWSLLGCIFVSKSHFIKMMSFKRGVKNLMVCWRYSCSWTHDVLFKDLLIDERRAAVPEAVANCGWRYAYFTSKKFNFQFFGRMNHNGNSHKPNLYKLNLFVE